MLFVVANGALVVSVLAVLRSDDDEEELSDTSGGQVTRSLN